MATAIDHKTESACPATALELLRLLGVKDKSVAKQFDSIMVWLTDHQTSPALWTSLLANGYALQLEQMLPSSCFHRPIPYRRITTASGTKEQMLL